MLSHSSQKNNATSLINYLDTGKRNLEKNDFTLALDNFLCALEIDDTNVTALSELAKIYNKLALLEKQKEPPNLESIKDYTHKHTAHLKEALEWARVKKKEETALKLQYAHLIKTHLIDPSVPRKFSQNLPTPNRETLLTLCNNMPNDLLLGWQYLKEKKYDIAIHYLNEHLIKIPYDFIALTQRGILYIIAKEDEKALADLNAALSVSNYSHSYHARAFIHLRTNQIQLAKQGFLDCLKFCIEDCTDYLRIVSNLDDIVKVLNDVTDQDNQDASLIPTIIPAECIEPREKIDFITHALKTDYKNPVLYTERGHTYYREKKYELAIIDFLISISLQDENASFDLHRLLRKSFIFLNNINAALVEFDTAIRLHSDRENEVSLEFSSELHAHAKKKLLEGHIKSAIISLNIAIDRNDKNTDIHLDLAIALFLYKNFTEALHHINLVLRSNSNDKQALQVYKQIQYECMMQEDKQPRTIILEQGPAVAFNPTVRKKYKPIENLPETPTTKTKQAKKVTANSLPKKKATDYNLLMRQKKEYAKLNAERESSQLPTSESPTSEMAIDIINTDDTASPISESTLLSVIETSQTKPANKKKKKKKNKEKPVEPDELIEKPIYKPSEMGFLFFNTQPAAPEVHAETALENIKIALPDSAVHCLTLLKKEGHKSFVTGGMPRDSVIDNKRIIMFDEHDSPYSSPKMDLEKTNHLQGGDIDIITTQPPEEIERLFAALKLEKIKNVPGLYRIKNFNNMTIDIFFSEQLQVSLYAAAQVSDFTVNTLFVDEKFNVYDPTKSAMRDIMQGVLNTTISASLSFLHDSIRILRGVYLATKCQLTPTPTLLKHMGTKKILLMQNETGKINVWLKKLFLHGHAEENYKKLRSLEIIDYLFPTMAPYMQKDESRILAGLKLTDKCRSPSLSKIFQSFLASVNPTDLSTNTILEKEPLIENEFTWQNTQAASFKYAMR